jgi:hypothetical protein
MAFDWNGFLTARHIPFVTSGPSVTRGNIGIKCPFCADDPSEHLAVALNGDGWHCWRNRTHSGKSPARLVSALLRCSMEQAHLIVGTRRHIAPDFASQVRGLIDGNKAPTIEREPLEFLPEFKRFRGSTTTERPFAEYLNRSRGFDDPVYLSRTYGLRYARRGRFAYRVIFPVYHDGVLVNWTGRAINGDASLRYMTLSSREDAPPPRGIGPISNYLLWYDELQEWDAETLVVVEGPFDALKVNVLGERHGIAATCFFTTAPSRQQVDLLHTLAHRFKRRVLLQDEGAESLALQTRSDLAALDFELIRLPKHLSDPGEMSSLDISDIFA